MLHFKTHFKTFLTLYLKKKEIKKAVIQGLNFISEEYVMKWFKLTEQKTVFVEPQNGR